MKAVKVLLVALMLVLVAVPVVGAQGGGNWDSSFTVINLGTADATVTVTFYDEAGAAVTPTDLGGGTTNPFTVAAGASKEILVFQVVGLGSGRYSVVISADQPVAAIANLTNTISGTAPSFSGSYSGFEDVGQMDIYMPAVLQGYYGWNSHLSAQNLTGAAMDLDVEIYTEGTNTPCYSDTQNVPAYASWHIDVGAETLTGCDVNADGFNGAAKFSAAGAIGVIDNQTADAYGQTVTYRGFTSGAETIYVPALYYLYYGWFSSINVQNVGAAATDITINYSDAAADVTCTAVAPGAGCFALNLIETGHSEKFSAVVSGAAGSSLVAVAQAGTTTESGLNQAFAYEAFLAGGTSYGLPLTMDMYYGWFTSFTMQNLGAADVLVDYSYAPDASVSFAGADCQATVPAGGNLEVIQTADACVDLPAGYHGGVTVAVNGVGEIIAIVSQNNVDAMTSAPGDWSMSYDGVVVP